MTYVTMWSKGAIAGRLQAAVIISASLAASALKEAHAVKLPSVLGGNIVYPTDLPLQELQEPMQLNPYGVPEDDPFYLPLLALRHGLEDALAWHHSAATGEPFLGTSPPPDYVTQSGAAFFFGENNGTSFKALRQLYGFSDRDYLRSFESGFNIFASNSKSRQTFCFTRDEKFIIKTMSLEEHRALSSLLGSYWQHMLENPRSLLVQYCGHYQVRVYRGQSGEYEDFHFLVMRNLLNEPRPDVVMTERYDCKGSTVGRAVTEADRNTGSSQVMKDLDLLQRPVPVYFGRAKGAFMEQMGRDVDFLKSHGVMDYSLLLGVCPLPRSQPPPRQQPQRKGILQYFQQRFQQQQPSNQQQEHHTMPVVEIESQGGGGGWVVTHPHGVETYIAGIIDLLQVYNRRKRAETLLKSVMYDRRAISAVDPEMYAARFMSFLDRVLVGDAGGSWGQDFAQERLEGLYEGLAHPNHHLAQVQHRHQQDRGRPAYAPEAGYADQGWGPARRQ